MKDKLLHHLFNTMNIRKYIGKRLLEEMRILGVDPAFVGFRSGLHSYNYIMMINGGSMGSMQKNRNLENFWIIAKSIPIPRKLFDQIIKDALIEDELEYHNKYYVDREVAVGYFKKYNDQPLGKLPTVYPN